MLDGIALRREFHRYAEQSWHEIRTSARIAELLAELGYEPKVGPEAVDTSVAKACVAGTDETRREDCARAVREGAKLEWVERTCGYPGVVAELNTGLKGPVTALRFDIDALPYAENQDPAHPAVKEEYVSTRDAVHACGHDGHAAIGLLLAERLKQNQHELTGIVRLLFQPAEENFGGAESMVAKGYLDDVNHFIAQHIAISGNGKPLPSHTLACGCDDFMSYTRLDVTFHGEAAHPCGASQKGRNAILAASAAALGIHSIAPHEDGLMRVNVGLISGGVAVNTIAPEARICLEYRGVTDDIDAYADRRVHEVLAGAAMMFDCTAEVLNYGSTSVAKSDRSLMDVVAAAAGYVPWFSGKIFYLGNVGGSDDATVMMRRVQQHGGDATYFGLGADTAAALHNESFDFCEDCLEASADLVLNIVKKLCTESRV